MSDTKLSVEYVGSLRGSLNFLILQATTDGLPLLLSVLTLTTSPSLFLAPVTDL